LIDRKDVRDINPSQDIALLLRSAGLYDGAMSALSRQLKLLTPEEYLAWELRSPVKHEYLGGSVHALTDFKNIHNAIAGNVFVALGRRCSQKYQVFNSNTKVRLRMPGGQVRFYYPDAQVVCEQNSPQESFQDHPVVVVEVLSPSTRRADLVEKLAAYTTIPTLETYLLVDSNARCVTVHQRSPQGFERIVLEEDRDVARLPSMNAEVPIAEFYENTVPMPPSAEDIFEYGY
jgi:Uma2 family endonuclease